MSGKRLLTNFVISISTLTVFIALPLYAAETTPIQNNPVEAQFLLLKQENETLSSRIKQLESVKGISSERLRLKKAQRLKEIADDLRAQRRTTKDFEGFVRWMSTNLAGYNRYIQAGSYAAVVARVLPIPYAGQASIFTKFVTQFTIALNESSVSLTKYLNSSWTFIVMADAIDVSRAIDDKAVRDAALFADNRLLKDMNEAQAKLSAVSDLSAGALSFLESINHYVSGTDEYWNKAKGVFKKNIDPKEKSFISESTNSLKTQADMFNSKLRSFGELGQKETAGVKALAVYDDLSNEILGLNN